METADGTLYAAFKSNATGGVGGIYEKMFHLFNLNRETYLQHYHKRSNVESTFSMVKRKFGDALRSKTDDAMVNESLAKLLAHNLCCLIAAWYELDIDRSFGEKPAPDDAPQDVLCFPAGLADIRELLYILTLTIGRQLVPEKIGLFLTAGRW